MLDKNVDMLILGRNFLSFILSIQLLDHGKRVLLLNDDRIQFGELFSEQIGLLEKNLLEVCGEDRRISSLVDIERFLKKSPLTLVFGGKRVRLGQTPYLNLRELRRKIFPDLHIDDVLSEEEFDASFYNYVDRLGKYFFRYKEMPGLRMDDFLTHCPMGLSLLFEKFAARMEDEVTRVRPVKNPELACLFYQAKAIFQKRMGLSSSRFELFHLFLCMLSPQYSLDQESLLEELLSLHRERGGRYKENRVKEWIFDKGRPWSLELDSFEGVIHPQKVSLLGGIPRGMTIRLMPEVGCYTSTVVHIDLPAKALKEFAGQKFAFSSSSKMGTSMPLWTIEALDEKLKMVVLYNFDKGSKIVFKREKIEVKLRQELAALFPWLSEHLGAFEFFDSHEIITNDRSTLKKTSKTAAPDVDKAYMVDISRPGQSTRLKQVFYFGPYRQGPMGLLSCLMEVKNHQRFL